MATGAAGWRVAGIAISFSSGTRPMREPEIPKRTPRGVPQWLRVRLPHRAPLAPAVEHPCRRRETSDGGVRDRSSLGAPGC